MPKQRKKPLSEYLDLTQHQLHALTEEYNLADAHTHQSQSPSQRKIVERLPQLWHEAETLKQQALEERFIQAFFTFHRQNYALQTPTLLVYAASIAMVIFANYFKKKKLSVSLITPCFDNLHDILKHMQVPLKPLQESWLHHPETIYETLKKKIKTEVVFVVSPNNPTGWELTGKSKKDYAQGFKEVIRFCKDHQKILAFDFCFASFLLADSKIPTFDVYQLLEKSGVRYLTVEDTGKTWPLQDAKVALIKTSQDLYEEIYNIHTAYLLNVSPFILNLVTAYIEDSQEDGCKSIYTLLRNNRATAKKAMANSLLEFQEPASEVSVAWFKIKNPSVKASELQEYIFKKKQVYVLPGTYFFWNNRSLGERYLRVALARDPEMFVVAMQRVREAIDNYEKNN